MREAVGGPTGGHWNVLVEQPGNYEFTLRRWPEQTGAALDERYDVSEKSPPNKPNVKTVAFPTIARARLRIAEKDLNAERLVSGCRRTDLCGAFFVTVRRAHGD